MNNIKDNCGALDSLRSSFLAGKLNKYVYSSKLHEVHMRLTEYSDWLRDSELSEITIKKDAVYLKMHNGLRFILDAEDQYIPPVQILNFKDYEKVEREILFNILTPGMTIYDVGANIGWYSLLLGKRMTESVIFAFEPIRSTFLKLQENIKLNELDNIKAFNFGLSNQEEEKVFYYAPEISGAASGANILGWNSVKTEHCHLRKLDDVWRENNCPIDFIKCDVEGAELFVFLGGQECLARDQPIIFCEMLRKWSAKFNYHPNQIIDLLKALSYDCYAIENNKLKQILSMEEDTEATNFIFLHDKKHVVTIDRLTKSYALKN